MITEQNSTLHKQEKPTKTWFKRKKPKR